VIIGHGLTLFSSKKIKDETIKKQFTLAGHTSQSSDGITDAPLPIPVLIHLLLDESWYNMLIYSQTVS
jgi:hypothetical protein